MRELEQQAERHNRKGEEEEAIGGKQQQAMPRQHDACKLLEIQS